MTFRSYLTSAGGSPAFTSHLTDQSVTPLTVYAGPTGDDQYFIESLFVTVRRTAASGLFYTTTASLLNGYTPLIQDYDADTDTWVTQRSVCALIRSLLSLVNQGDVGSATDGMTAASGSCSSVFATFQVGELWTSKRRMAIVLNDNFTSLSVNAFGLICRPHYLAAEELE